MPVNLLKRLLVILIIGFVLFYVITRPQAAADAVQAVWGWILAAVTAIGNFFLALAS